MYTNKVLYLSNFLEVQFKKHNTLSIAQCSYITISRGDVAKWVIFGAVVVLSICLLYTGLNILDIKASAALKQNFCHSKMFVT
jgi:hypothetical protein